MKNKNDKVHHISIHQRLEYMAHHHLVLGAVLSFMAVGLIKYETQLVYVLHDAYNQGFGLMSTYTHHHETLRMPIEYGADVRPTPISSK